MLDEEIYILFVILLNPCLRSSGCIVTNLRLNIGSFDITFVIQVTIVELRSLMVLSLELATLISKATSACLRKMPRLLEVLLVLIIHKFFLLMDKLDTLWSQLYISWRLPRISAEVTVLGKVLLTLGISNNLLALGVKKVN